jgi:hypothetical protein
MAVTMKNVRAALDPEEPDYKAAAALGAEAIPHLRALVAGDDPMLASKAAYLASLIGAEGAGDVLLAAAESPHEAVRVAAADGARNLAAGEASAVLTALVADEHPAVRARARASVPSRPSKELARQLERVEEAPEAGEAGASEPVDLGRPMPGEAGTGLMPGEGGAMPGEQMPGRGTMPD